MLLGVHAICGSASAPSLISMESEWILGPVAGPRGAFPLAYVHGQDRR
jgi:hypothetical protein